MRLIHGPKRDRGVALVLVLCFVVLLAGLIIAYFSRTLTDRQLSDTSFNQTKADELAKSATEIIVGDLKQEIALTSTATPTTGGTIYVPLKATFAVPSRSYPALVTGSDPIPNLVRLSGSGTSALNVNGADVGVGGGSLAVSSTTPSLNYRSVSVNRWNSHYLVPRLTGTGPTISSFTAPCWVLMTKQGPQVLTTPTNSVIGRFAYAIYDEGGLLDVNVAGYPSTSSASQISTKSGASFADLTQLPTTSGVWTQKQIDQLLGWRNYATIQPSGNLPNFNLPSTSGSSYYSLVASNTTGFLKVTGSSWNNATNQAVINRQQLIALQKAIGFSPDVLQYLGTFSRDLEQPSIFPNPGRPMVQASGWNNKSTSGSNVGFGTGNDAYGSDRNSQDPAQDINPPFLTVRVKAPFKRNDGTEAHVNDPLVLKRFPLSRLVWITSKGGSADNMGSSVVQQAISALGGDPSNPNDPIYQYVANGTAANILASFGLTWKNGYWSYDHGNNQGILRLSDVAALSPGREPDFFELLKAAINVGSLAKGSCYDYSNTASDWTTPGTSGYLQQARDTLSALQILQIGANIVDQSKGDNFPTRIQFAGDASIPVNEVRGIEDLPYLYGFRNWITRYTQNSFAVFMQPELWNPHSRGSSANVSSSATPGTFRVRVIRNPGAAAKPITLNVYYYSGVGASRVVGSTPFDASNFCNFNDPNYDPAAPSPAPLVFKAGELNNFWGFREPTLLGVSTMPASANLASTSYNDITTKVNTTGVLLAQSIPWVSPVTGGATDTPNKLNINVSSDNASLRFYLEYQDPNGIWIPYDEQVFEYQRGGASLDMHTIANYTTYSQAVSNLDWCGAVRTDPRTNRWGFMYTEYFNAMGAGDSNNQYPSFRWDGGISYGSHLGGKEDKGFIFINNYPKQYRGFQHGYWAENTTRATFQTDTSGQLLRYNRDPDGVARRAMGGYVTDVTNGGTAAQANQPQTGLPMYQGNYSSRPTILHRPFRSIAELGYAFRDTPWGHINFSFPESGDSALLDLFCINEISGSTALIAGHVNLNTHQAPVLQALISGELVDKDDSNNPLISGTVASDLAKQLVTRTSAPSAGRPLTNRGDLVGAWTYGNDPVSAVNGLKSNPDPALYYTGFSADVGTTPSTKGTPISLIPRQRESVMRALSDSGNVRVWNLMIDIVAQSGRYPANSKDLSQFVVAGEKRYWMHVAIDRLTGKVLDKQLELVIE